MFWIFESTNIKHQNFPPFYLIKYHKCVIQPDFIVLNRAMRIQTHVFRCLVSRHFSISYNVCYSSSSLTLCITYAQPLWWKARRVPKQTLKIWTQQHLKYAWIYIEFHNWNPGNTDKTLQAQLMTYTKYSHAMYLFWFCRLVRCWNVVSLTSPLALSLFCL